jgi:hypothetical protein
MNGLHPTVRYLIVCDDVVTEPGPPSHSSIIHLLTHLRSRQEPPFPVTYGQLCVFVLMTECRGPAEVKVRVVQADTEDVLSSTQTRTVPFPNDPLDIARLVFRLRGVTFPEAGLYLIRFVYNEKTLAEQPLIVH